MAAPHVLGFDREGTFLDAWGGPGDGYEWPQREHGIHIDHQGFVWLGGHNCPASNEPGLAPVSDDQLLKFTLAGEFVMQIGRSNTSRGNADTLNLHGPADAVVHPPTRELLVADGYGNHRVAVFDADTGAFKRMWGAYGNEPVDGPLPARTPDSEPSQQFTGVHCIKMSQDGLLYVCDRPNNRVQVFQKDGTFVQEGFVATGSGTVADVAFSSDPEERFVYVADGTNRKVWILRRDTMETVGSFGNWGNYGGEFAAYMHAIASDSKGNVYVGEFQGGDRVQRFKVVGFEGNP